MTTRPTGRIDGGLLPVGLLAAPFQVATAVISILIALLFLLQALATHSEPVSILQALLAPPWVWVWGGCMAGGGALTILGVFQSRASSLSTEILGLGLLSTAWLVYAVALAIERGASSTIPVAFGCAVVVASAIRARALLTASKVSADVRGGTSTSKE